MKNHKGYLTTFCFVKKNSRVGIEKILEMELYLPFYLKKQKLKIYLFREKTPLQKKGVYM